MSDMGKVSDRNTSLAPIGVILSVLGLLVAELLVISLLYNHNFVFECRAMGPAALCGFLSAAVMRAIGVIGVLGLFVMVRPSIVQGLQTGLRDRVHWGSVVLQLAGFALILAPWTFLDDTASGTVFWVAVVVWLVGALAAGIGAIFALVSPSGWMSAARAAGPALAVMVGIAGLGPEIADLGQNLWKFEPLTEFTFNAVASILTALGYEVVLDSPTKYIAIGDFAVLVGRQCSGVEGFVLITGFLALYVWLFRHKLRFPHVWLLLPVGIVLSWAFNLVRIAVLILIGANGAPGLAVNGFHSHAGWLMFTLLSLSLAFVAHRLVWFRKDDGAAHAKAVSRPAQDRLPFFEDPTVAQILPFIVFMAAGLLLSTITSLPDIYYPFKFAAMFVGLLFFWRYLRGLGWSFDPVSLGVGALVAVLWLATALPGGNPDLATALAALPASGLVVWVVLRMLGTSLLVPIIEELFFRGYILRRLDHGGMLWRLIALGVSSGLFALLHDRWVVAFVAGLAFGLVFLRRRRVSDAILAHGTANVIIALWAVSSGDWSLI